MRGSRRKPDRAYLNSMVFIFGALEECNSRLVLFLAMLGEFDVVVSELVVEEVERFFRENFSREAGYLARKFVEALSAKVVRRADIRGAIERLRGTVKEKDLENVAAVKSEGIPYLVAYDDDYARAGVEEYVTPKDFVKLFGLRPYDVEY